MWRVFDQPIGTFVPFFWCVVRISHSIRNNKRLLRADSCCRSVIKEFAHAFSCAYIELWMHLGSLESTKKLELLSAAPRATLTHFSRSPNFPLVSITRYPHAKHEQILKYSRWLTQKRKFSLGLDSKNFLKSSLLPTLVLYLRLK